MEYEYNPLTTGLLVAILACSLILTIFLVAAQWKVFCKGGSTGWACIIPIYNTYIMLKIAGKPGWWLLMFFTP